MRSQREQIEAILHGGVAAWAKEQLAEGESLADRQYRDFIDVTPEQVVEHVLRRGFDGRTVWTPDDPPRLRDNRLVVEPRGAQWICGFTERGDDYDVRAFDRREDAVRDAVARLLVRAWTALNVGYWHKHHPELERLPLFGAAWPVTGSAGDSPP